MTRPPWVVGVSGACGTPYARAVLGGLLDAGQPVDLVVSRAARLTLLDETGAVASETPTGPTIWRPGWVATWPTRTCAYWPPADLAAGPSSGSYPTRGMVVVPASHRRRCAGIALGLSKDLLQRAADVTLKERRRWSSCRARRR